MPPAESCWHSSARSLSGMHPMRPLTVNMAGTVIVGQCIQAALGHQPILRIIQVEALFALHPGFMNARVDAERIARKKDEIRVLAGHQRADPVTDIEHVGGYLSQSFERRVTRHSRPYAHRGHAQEMT